MKYITIIENIDADTGEIINNSLIKNLDYYEIKRETNYKIDGRNTVKTITRILRRTGQKCFEWYEQPRGTDNPTT